jgi:hypothetical protein
MERFPVANKKMEQMQLLMRRRPTLANIQEGPVDFRPISSLAAMAREETS